MANRNDNHLQGNMYDKLFKENIQQNLSGIVKHVLSLDVTTIEVLNEDVQYTKERKKLEEVMINVADFFKKRKTHYFVEGMKKEKLKSKSRLLVILKA